MNPLEVVVDTRDIRCGQVITEDGVGQSTLAGPEVEQAHIRLLHRPPPTSTGRR